VGDSLTIEPDAFYLTLRRDRYIGQQYDGRRCITRTRRQPHRWRGGRCAEVVDNSDPQSINDRVQATILNGAAASKSTRRSSTSPRWLDSSTLLATAPATLVTRVAPFGTLNAVGAGASGATINLTLSQATDGSAAADWTVPRRTGRHLRSDHHWRSCLDEHHDDDQCEGRNPGYGVRTDLVHRWP